MAEKIVTKRTQGWLGKLKRTLANSGLDEPTVTELLHDDPTVQDVIKRMERTGLDKKTIRDVLSHAGVKAETKIKRTDTIADPHPEAEKHIQKFSDKKEKLMIALITVLSFVAGYLWGGYLL